MTRHNIIKLAVSLALPLVIGFLGSFFTAPSMRDGWYASLNQPSFNPPSSVFGPVWTILYVLMGISLYLVWKQRPDQRRENALGVFALQLLLNFLWSLFFFYFKEIQIALLDIIALWISIVVMIWLFYRIKPMAGLLNIPYLLWVTFATALNIAYFILN